MTALSRPGPQSSDTGVPPCRDSAGRARPANRSCPTEGRGNVPVFRGQSRMTRAGRVAVPCDNGYPSANAVFSRLRGPPVAWVDRNGPSGQLRGASTSPPAFAVSLFAVPGGGARRACRGPVSGRARRGLLKEMADFGKIILPIPKSRVRLRRPWPVGADPLSAMRSENGRKVRPIRLPPGAEPCGHLPGRAPRHWQPRISRPHRARRRPGKSRPAGRAARVFRSSRTGAPRSRKRRVASWPSSRSAPTTSWAISSFTTR